MIKHGDGKLTVEAGTTFADPTVEEVAADKNVQLALHKVGNRIVRYAMSYRTSKGLPRTVKGRFYTTLHYGALKRVGTERKSMQVLYHDNMLRLLAFGDNAKERDYMIVVRR